MKMLFIKALAVLNFSEGIIHIITAAVSFWGMYSLGVWDWRVATSPTFDIFLGIVSLVTGVVLNKWGCQHHKQEENVQVVQAVDGREERCTGNG